MAHEIYRVNGLQKLAPFTLSVQFNDGTSQTIDFRPVLEGICTVLCKTPQFSLRFTSILR
jgi:hypothetical protein